MNLSRAPAEPGQPNSQQPHIIGETTLLAPSLANRARPVATACERCRRRKIRCDGETPCATCRRFRVNCIRPPKNDTQALEHRVRQLEAQIADMTGNLPSPQGQELSTATSTRPWTPDPPLIGNLGSPGPSIPMTRPFAQFASDNNASPLDIPRIEVVDFAASSPASLSTSPSLHPLNATTSGAIPGFRPPSLRLAISPPMTACPSPTYDPAPYLTPTSVADMPRSRSSSVSSLNLDYDWHTSSPSLSISGLSDPTLGIGMFDTLSSPTEFEYLPVEPTKYEAETILDKFYERTRGSGYPIERERLLGFLDIIKGPWEQTGRQAPLSCPPSMARFHVYMAMAVGLRMEGGGRPTSMQLLHNCYRLAIDEVRSPAFWQQLFGTEAAILLSLFAQVSRGASLR